jgi:Uncharacterized alpha/beta hydrolase domain (DUF2235)
LNERRAPFTPTIWTLPAGSKTDLRQVWFPGCHGDVGGGNIEHALSNIALVWMIEQVQSIEGGQGASTLEFDVEYLTQSDATIALSTKTKPWGCTDYEDTYTGVYELSGIKNRTPTLYAKDAEMVVHECVAVRKKWYSTQPKPWKCPDISGLKFSTLGKLETSMQKGFPSP